MISHYWVILEPYVTNHTWMRYLIPSNKPFQRYYFSHQSLQHLVRPWHFFMPELELMKGQVSKIRFLGRNGLSSQILLNSSNSTCYYYRVRLGPGSTRLAPYKFLRQNPEYRVPDNPHHYLVCLWLIPFILHRTWRKRVHATVSRVSSRWF